MRTHVDEVTFQVGKDSRDMLRAPSARCATTSPRWPSSSHLDDGLGRGRPDGRSSQREAERKTRIGDLKAELERVEQLAGAGLHGRWRSSAPGS